MIENIITLLMLVMLQAVLGFDNLLYISLESKRAPKDRQPYVRKMGIGLAVIFRIILLFVLVRLIASFQKEVFAINIEGILYGSFNFHSLIVLLGGIFILYTAVKEIWHMMNLDQAKHIEKKPGSVSMIIATIIMMNLVFSFDSILSAIALTDNIYIMATAIIIGGILMIWLSEKVSTFLEKNRMYEVLGLFVLFIVGIMLITEGGHLAHLSIVDNEIMPMTKTTFYFVIFILVIIDVVQGRYQKKLSVEKINQEELKPNT